MVPALRSRFVACLLIVFTVLGTSGTWHVADDRDFDTPTHHDHSAHHARFNAATPADGPTHCAICHWLQGFRTDAVPDTRIAHGDAGAVAILALNRAPVQQLARLDVPSRAPPA